MKNLKSKLFSGILLTYLTVSAGVLSADVPVPTGNYTDSRSKALLLNPSGGLVSEGLIGSLLTYSINWTVTNLGGGNYHYLYSFSNLAGLSAAQSDLFLQLGSTTSLTNLSNIQVNGGLINTLIGVTVSDATFSGDHGIIFDSTASVLINSVAFDVQASPIWGDFENGSLLGLLGDVRNVGFGTTPTSPFTNWIATPGSVAVISTPEPATWSFLGLALILGSCLKRVKSKKLA